MAAHVLHRDVDAERPASLSPVWIEWRLRSQLGFDGMVVSDSIDMRAVSDTVGIDEAAILAIEAGSDVVVDGFNLIERNEHPAPRLRAALQRAFDAGRLHRERIEASVARIDRLRAQLKAQP